jgi:hypothetical protein
MQYADNAVLPAWLTASWQRLWVSDGAGGALDRSVNVRNIQTPSLFGDCRIPGDRPDFAHATTLADLSDAELATLYQQEGFAGVATASGYVVTWHHQIDYQPPDGSVDIGRFELPGGRNALEHGVEASYLEHWWRLEDAGGAFFGVKVMRRDGTGRQRVHQILAVAGDHFIYARNRAADLPLAGSMGDLIRTKQYSRKQVLAALDCEVSHGFVAGGRVPWEVQFSTLPFREHKALQFAAQVVVDPATGACRARTLQPDLAWSFPVNTLGIADLLVLFPQGEQA